MQQVDAHKSDHLVDAEGSYLARLLHHDATPGVLLALAALAAMIAYNSPLAPLYDALLTKVLAVTLDGAGIEKPILLWINDGLMAIFFFLVGLEIKREMMVGNLSSYKAATFPAIGALGGIAIPAMFYALINAGSPETISGWAIPAATDIAFALGALALVGSRLPPALKLFLLALAVLDDLAAILLIAVFYSADLSIAALVIAALGMATLIGFNVMNVTRVGAYVLVGLIVWVAVLKSGVHATLAGVAIAFTIPLTAKEKKGPLEGLEHSLHPWVAFAILPLFAFANAGVSLSGLSFSDLLQPLPLGIVIGLVVGKPVGIMGFCYLSDKIGIAKLPDGVNWFMLYGVTQLAGIGFTMSLFIGTLAFSSEELQAAVRIGVLAGSAISIVAGMAALNIASRRYSTNPSD